MSRTRGRHITHAADTLKAGCTESASKSQNDWDFEPDEQQCQLTETRKSGGRTGLG